MIALCFQSILWVFVCSVGTLCFVAHSELHCFGLLCFFHRNLDNMGRCPWWKCADNNVPLTRVTIFGIFFSTSCQSTVHFSHIWLRLYIIYISYFLFFVLIFSCILSYVYFNDADVTFWRWNLKSFFQFIVVPFSTVVAIGRFVPSVHPQKFSKKEIPHVLLLKIFKNFQQ